MVYSTDPAGLNKECRLETLPESNLPAIELMALTGDVVKQKVNFTDKNNDGIFTDEQPNPFSTPVGAGVMFSMKGTMDVFQKHFDWSGLDNAGLTIKCELIDSAYNDPGYSRAARKFQFFGNSGKYVPVTGIEFVAHEYTHGVFHHRTAYGSIFPIPPLSIPTASINEAFADIFSVFVRKEVEKALDYNWVVGENLVAGGIRNFVNPNLTKQPDTYKGNNWQDWGDPKFKPHKNAGIINHCFYLLAVGSNGIQKNDHGTEFNCVGIGVPKAIEIFWETMPKLTSNSDFFDLRKKTLEVVHEMGHPIGSELDLALREAWKAVGLGMRIETFGQECEVNNPKTAESIYYGFVPLATSEVKTAPDASGSAASILLDCSQDGRVGTSIFNPTQSMYFIDTDDADQIYTLDNDVALSRKGVSAHFTTCLAREHFKDKYQFVGLDGQGGIEINNSVGPKAPSISSGYNKETNYFNYLDDDNVFTIDQIAGTYFSGIYGNVKNVKLPESAESIAIRFALQDIFGSEVNNQYRISKNQQPVWTIGADAFGGANYLRSLSDPTQKGQLNFYNGLGWAGATPEQRAGVWTQFYYLISNGTGPNGFTNENGQTRFFTKLEDDVPGKIIFEAFSKFLPANPTFDDMAVAIQSSLLANSYKETSATWKKCMDALTCVLGKEFVDQPKIWAVNADDIEIKEVQGFDARFRSDVFYPGKEEISLTEVSEDVAFDDLISPVYRAFQHTTEVLLPYIDEKDPGKQTTTAKFYLEGGKKYFVRRRLYAAGGQGCASLLGGYLECRNLEKMANNWSPILEVTTASITTLPISPLEHDKIPAWNSVIEWQATPGAAGYILRVTDLTGEVPAQDFPVEAVDDEKEAKELALAKERDYSWQVIATHKLGSEEGVTWDKGSKSFMKTGLTDTDIFGDWLDPISFQTDLPETPLLVPPSPADGEHVPPFGKDLVLSAEETPGVSGYRFHIQDKKDDMESPQVLYDHENLKLPDQSDGKVYTWAFEPYKEATPPFITEKEFGKKYFSTFVLDYSLVPAPVLVSPKNDQVVTFQYGGAQGLAWSEVTGAHEYEYTIYRTSDDAIIPNGLGSTIQTAATIPDALMLPLDKNGGFKWRVRAKAKDDKGDWIYGPYSKPFFYWLRPEKSNLFHPSENQQDVDISKLEFSWANQWAPDGYLFRLHKNNQVVFEKATAGTSIMLTNLEYGVDYAWDALAMNVTPTGTHYPDPYTFHHFSTMHGANNGEKKVKEYDPDEEQTTSNDPNNPGNTNDSDDDPSKVFYPQLGFTVDLTDNDFSDIHSYSYRVTVTSDKGYFREWDCAVNGFGVVFIPEDLFQTKINGDLPEDTALYHFHIEITNLNGKDDSYATGPGFDFRLYLYDGLPAHLQNGKMPFIDMLPKSGVFGGRWVGASVDFDFDYIFSTKKP
ncbi:M4 family metallopeptidase [Dyadobacter psychrophilus]|nr:M4 family metallopeptidase [Dyadobacter psychrophilus]